MKLETFLRALEVSASPPFPEVDVAGITCDSRQVRPGFIFVAVPGTRVDGWSFVNTAVERGAIAVVTERDEPVPRPACGVRVPDARQALARLASILYGHPSTRLQVIGVTGTNGKTTVTFLCRHILQADGRRPGLIGTVEYQIGERVIPASRTTPEAPALQEMLAQMVTVGCRSVAMEVSSHALDQHRTDGIDFDVAVFTNLTGDHLDYHHTMEAYFAAKVRLFDGLGTGGKSAVAVVNLDDPWGQKLMGRPGVRAQWVTFALQHPADVTAHRPELRRDGTHFDLQTPWGHARVSLPLLGRYNISNALAAVAACGALGVPLSTIVDALALTAPVPGRLEEIPTGRDFRVFVDYAHTEAALFHVLTTLRELGPRRLLVVFGCGGDRDRTKRPQMGAVACRLADVSIVTSDNPRSEDPKAIIAEVRSGFDDPSRMEAIPDRASAIQRALDLAGPGDIVLVAGKGHERFQELAHTLVAFDDRLVIRKLLTCQPSPPRNSPPGVTAIGSPSVPV